MIACTGHAITSGALLALTADNRIGTAGDFDISLNETAIGSPFPVFGVQLAKVRLNPTHLTQSFVQSRMYSPEEAVDVGCLDRAVAAGAVLDTAVEQARALLALPAETDTRNKLDIRQSAQFMEMQR